MVAHIEWKEMKKIVVATRLERFRSDGPCPSFATVAYHWYGTANQTLNQ